MVKMVNLVHPVFYGDGQQNRGSWEGPRERARPTARPGKYTFTALSPPVRGRQHAAPAGTRSSPLVSDPPAHPAASAGSAAEHRLTPISPKRPLYFLSLPFLELITQLLAIIAAGEARLPFGAQDGRAPLALRAQRLPAWPLPNRSRVGPSLPRRARCRSGPTRGRPWEN